MDESQNAALAAGPDRLSADRALPPAGGPLRTGQRKLADVLERAGRDGPADYVRKIDVDGVQDELDYRVRQAEDSVRARPLLSVAVALLAGFMVGRAFRD